MKKYINVCLSSLFALSVITACGRVDNTLLSTDSNLLAPAVQNGEFTAMGVSTKRFSLSFKANMTETQIKSLEQKYKAKFVKILPQIGIAVAEKSDAENTEAVANIIKSEAIENSEPIGLA